MELRHVVDAVLYMTSLNMLRARGCPQRQEPMVGIRERPTAADGDEAGVTLLGEDHIPLHRIVRPTRASVRREA